MITDSQKELIAIQVIRTLYSQFDKFPEDVGKNRNAPFHEAFLKAFTQKLAGKVESIPVFISLSSWMHGLNTSLGQSFFEKTAHILCDGEKKEFKDNKIVETQKNKISEIITGLQNGREKPNLESENIKIFECYEGNQVDADNFTADVFWVDEQSVVAIESKTVRPNSDISKQTKSKVLEAKASLRNRYPGKEINYFYAFPFDPYSSNPTEFNKEEFMRRNVNFEKYFAVDEILLASEFWDYLSGCENTMEVILEIINSIATTDFLKNFNFLSKTENITTHKAEYLQLLDAWFLKREKNIVEKANVSRLQTTDNKNSIKIFNQSIFNKGEYNIKRAEVLSGLVKKFTMI